MRYVELNGKRFDLEIWVTCPYYNDDIERNRCTYTGNGEDYGCPYCLGRLNLGEDQEFKESCPLRTILIKDDMDDRWHRFPAPMLLSFSDEAKQKMKEMIENEISSQTSQPNTVPLKDSTPEEREELDRLKMEIKLSAMTAALPSDKMELKDTIEWMTSSDYKERFKAEYWQLVIRCRKLVAMLIKYYAGTLYFVPDCNPISVLTKQLEEMYNLIQTLNVRARIEGIDLSAHSEVKQ